MGDSPEFTTDELYDLIRKATSDQLEPLEPEEGLKEYLKDRTEITEATKDEYEDSLSHFITFCENNEIDNLNELSGRSTKSYKYYREFETSEEVDQLCSKTMRDEMFLFRRFIRFLEDIDAVKSGLEHTVPIPDLEDGDGVRDYDLKPERVNSILQYLEKYHYASRDHVIWLLFSRTGRRPGCQRSLDKGDVNLEGENPYISFSHQVETPLKNNKKSEQEVNIDEDVADVLRDYISEVRPNITENGREPLLASSDGRLSTSSMRKCFYDYTRPCKIGNPCPVDRDPETCEAAKKREQASKCPSSEPPYSTRHGHITELRKQNVPIEMISERCDVSPEVIKKHYDERSVEEKRDQRRDILDELDDTSNGYL